MIVAADDTDMGYPEINVGIVPAIHFVHLPRQISRHKAFELLFFGRSLLDEEDPAGHGTDQSCRAAGA